MKSKSELEQEVKDLENLVTNPDVPAAAKKDAEGHIEKIKAQIAKLDEKPAAAATAKKEKKSHKKKPAEGGHPAKKERKSHKAKPGKKEHEPKKGGKKSHKKEAPKKSHHKAKPKHEPKAAEHHKPAPAAAPAAPAKKKLKKKFERKEYKPKHVAHHEPTVFHKIAEAEKLLSEIPREIRALEDTAREKAIHEFREKLRKSGVEITHRFAGGGNVPGDENFFNALLGFKKKEYKGGGGVGRGGENLHPHVRIPKSERLAHGYEVAKNAPVHKKENFSTPTVKVDTGHRLVKGYELEKGKKGKQYKGGGGLDKLVKPSAELAAVVGSAPISRAQITSKIWKHIKENGLQDPKNKRNINTDAKLKAIFGGKSSVTMFEIPKHVSANVS